MAYRRKWSDSGSRREVIRWKTKKNIWRYHPERREEVIEWRVRRFYLRWLAWTIRQAKRPPPGKIGRPRQTHCCRGHELSGKNLYLVPGGKHKGRRICRLCTRGRVLKAARKRRGLPLDMPTPAEREAALKAQLKAELEERRRWMARPKMKGVSE